MRDHAATRGGNVGLTDQTTPDLYGIVVPLHSGVDVFAEDAGKETKSLSGGCRGAKPPTSRVRTKLRGRALRRAQRRQMRLCTLACASCDAVFEGPFYKASLQALRHTCAHAAQLSLLELREQL